VWFDGDDEVKGVRGSDGDYVSPNRRGPWHQYEMPCCIICSVRMATHSLSLTIVKLPGIEPSRFCNYVKIHIEAYYSCSPLSDHGFGIPQLTPKLT